LRDEGEQLLPTGVDFGEVGSKFLGELLVFLQHLAVTEDVVDRCAQIMADFGQIGPGLAWSARDGGFGPPEWRSHFRPLWFRAAHYWPAPRRSASIFASNRVNSTGLVS